MKTLKWDCIVLEQFITTSETEEVETGNEVVYITIMESYIAQLNWFASRATYSSKFRNDIVLNLNLRAP